MLRVEIQNCFNSGSVGGTCESTYGQQDPPREGPWGRCWDQSIDVHRGLTHPTRQPTILHFLTSQLS